jgi:endonuclease/exonuclease/phosphatase family metal-dependent hydrolase
MGFINSQNADITCLQEYSAKGGDFTKAFGEVKRLTHYSGCYYSNYIPQKNYRIDALVILTNYPIVDSGTLVLHDDTRVFGIYTDLLYSADTIRLINLHLESIRFKSEDYQFVENMTKGHAEKESFKQGSISILRKLSTAYKRRSKQAEVVIENLKNCPYPVIICGDFNDTPLSYSYRKISSGLEDAFVKSGHGLGNTFAGDLPPLRIDYIFYSPVFTSYDFSIPDIRLSDHFPISTYLKLNKDSEDL